mgnify:FL=1
MSVTTHTVLWGQTIIYTIYVSVIILLMAWFAYNITRKGPSKVSPKAFYTFVGFLVTVGVSIHLFTYFTIPWKHVDLNAAAYPAAQTYDITMQDHQFSMPADVLEVPCNEYTEFNVVSNDLTYGFGVFRPDNSMIFQMQVVPWRDDNTIKWKFTEGGDFTIRSTEYSGPEGAQMILKDAIRVTGCEA